MAALSDLQLRTQACDFLLPRIAEAEEYRVDVLSNSGATRGVNALRSVRVQRTILAVGMLSLLEAFLQTEHGWDKPRKEFEKLCKENGHGNLSEELEFFWLAINVLKHAKGRSLDALKEREDLPFSIAGRGDYMVDEGDVSEGYTLVLADEKFVRDLADVIERGVQVSDELSEKTGDPFLA